MHYTIHYQLPLQHFIIINLKIDVTNDKTVLLELPTWRPGRYELGNFVENIQKITVKNAQGHTIPITKISKESWLVDTKNSSSIVVSYNYYAHQMDAGSSWMDEKQLYINFINCLLYIKEKMLLPCRVILDIPEDFEIACGLPKTDDSSLLADSYYHLVECPMIASNQLKHFKYNCDGTQFYIWFMGNCVINEPQLLSDFGAFTSIQTQMMGGFPDKEYHFLIQLTPDKSYHGVEHFNSTVITLGPSEKVFTGPLYNDLLGVCSHELFHSWNVIRIKPKEFIPYDFSSENYFETGYVAEGFTTYYGDLFLVRSRVLSKDWYFEELNKLFNRHLHNFGRLNNSLKASSFDLWVDGYKKGIPDRKVSIYTKGALVALIIDLKLRQISNNKQSLDDIMGQLWKRFGDTKSGYSHEDMVDIVQSFSSEPIADFFNELVDTALPIEDKLSEALEVVGCQLCKGQSASLYEQIFGFKARKDGNKYIITHIHPNGAAVNHLSLDDQIIAINGRETNIDLDSIIGTKTAIEITVFRQCELRTIPLNAIDMIGYTPYYLKQNETATNSEKTAFEQWLGIPWNT